MPCIKPWFQRVVPIQAAAMGVVAAAAILLVGCTGPADPSPRAVRAVTARRSATTERQITIDNFTFDPAELTVPAGTKVTWVNHDDVPHTATGAAREFDSGALDTDGRFSFVFATPGAYSYFCAVHPHMTGRIVVSSTKP